MSNWVDFRTLRERLDFVQVLQYFRVNFKRRGSQAVAPCPLPHHPKDKTPKPAPSFSVSLEKKIFQCFGCGAKGNVLDFISLMRGVDPRNMQAFREVALFAQSTFAIDQPQSKKTATPTQLSVSTAQPASRATVQGWRPATTATSTAGLPVVDQVHTVEDVQPEVVINQPLDFALKNLDTKPSYLLNRGFTEETINHFGLGLCTKGTFAGRIVIPLHDLLGKLIGYAGRLVFDDTVDEKNPKYLFPSRRERNGQILEFAKSLILYHGHAMSENPVYDLYVAQGFSAAWWLWQHGYKDVVAIMGSTCSVDQAKAILTLTANIARIWCFTDADKSGDKCAQSLFREIGQCRFCKWIRAPVGQVTDCDWQTLDELLEFPIEK